MNTTMPTLEELHALARDEGVWARGLRLAQQGAVSETTRRGPQIAARVAGSADEPYYVAATPPPEGQRRWQWHCTCFYFEHVAAPCKHIIALLVAWRRDAAQFSAEAARDALMGSADRDNAQAARRAELRRHPTLSALLALEPERAKPLKRALNLDPYAKQLDFAARRGEAHLWEGILQTAAGYLRIGDVANAQRLSSLLLERLLAQGDGPARLIAIRQRTLPSPSG